MQEAYICDAVRTPIDQYGGALSQVRADDLGAVPLVALVRRNLGVDWDTVDDVIFGCANQAGEDNRNVARMSALLAGLPESVSGTTINRLCGSGLDAVMQGARDQGGRGRSRDRRWRGKHEPRTLRHAESTDRVFSTSSFFDVSY